ncbi:MAG: hypothetical protein ACQRW7_04455 [Caulobacterales bacterium]|uniref:hypothetical protein n=1 Tax=Glycocaulis sp. TaxID=1969725 RepID=UPI003F9FF91C
MIASDDSFDAELNALFSARAPEPDPAFTAGVMRALPAGTAFKPLLLAAAGLLGLVIAAFQLPGLVGVINGMTGGAAALAASVIGPQALAMGVVAVGLAAVTHVLFRRTGLSL